MTTVAAFGQSAATGLVIDEGGLPIPYAQVIIYQGGKILAYESSDERGVFPYPVVLLSGEPGDRATSLSVRSFGYATLVYPMDELPADHRYVLAARPLSLDSVSVSAKALPAIRRGDTLTYDVDAYRSGTENRLEDLLQQLPGVEVDADGSITVDGEPIDRILVEGQDVFGTNYSLLSRNMGAQPVQRVGVINNYTDDDLVGDLSGEEELVLNVELRDGLQATVFGHAEAGVGTQGTTESDLNLFHIGRKRSSVFFAQQNTIGLPGSTADDLSIKTGRGGIGYDPTRLPSLLSSGTPDFPAEVEPEHYLDNSLISTAGSLLSQRKNKYRSRTLFSLDRARETVATSLLGTQVVGDTEVRERQTTDFLSLNRRFYLESENRIYFGDNSRLDITALTSATYLQSGVDLFAEVDDVRDSLLTDVASKPFTGLLNASFVRRLTPRNAFRIHLELSHTTNPQSARYASERYRQRFDSGELVQDNDLVLRGGRVSAEWMQRVGKMNMVNAVGVRQQTSRQRATLHPSGSEELIAIDRNGDELKLGLLAPYYGVSLDRTFKKGRVSGDIDLSYLNNRSEGSATEMRVDTNLLAVQSSISLEYNLTPRFKVQLNGRESRSLPELDNFSGQTYLRDYETVFKGLPETTLQRQTMGELRFTYANLFRQLNISWGSQVVQTHNAVVQNITRDTLLSLIRLSDGGRPLSVTSYVSVDKYLAFLRGNVRLDYRNYSVSNPATFNGGSGTNRLYLNSIQARFDTRLSPVVQFHGSYSLSLARSEYENDTNRFTGATSSQDCGTELVLGTTEKWYVAPSSHYLRWSTDLATDNALLLSLDSYYQISPRVGIGLKGYNLANRRDVTRTVTTGFENSRVLYPLRPAFVIARVNWQFS